LVKLKILKRDTVQELHSFLDGWSTNFEVKSFPSVKPKYMRHNTHNCLATWLAHSLFVI